MSGRMNHQNMEPELGVDRGEVYAGERPSEMYESCHLQLHARM